MQMTRRHERPEACLTQQGEAREPVEAERSWHDVRATPHTDVKCATSSFVPPSRPPATAALIRRRHLERKLNAGVFHVKHSFAFPRSAARLEDHSQPASCLGALHAPAPPRSSTAPRPDTPSVPPPPRHGSDTRQSPRPIITSPPRCPSPRCPAARRSRSICRARSRRTRRARGARRRAAPRPCPRAPSAPCAPRFRAARTRPRARRPRRRRGPPRATSRRPHRGPPPDAHASPPSPYPTLASTHRARTRHSRRPTVPAPDTRVASVMPYMSAPPRRIPQPHCSHPQGRMPVVHHLHLDPTRECFT